MCPYSIRVGSNRAIHLCASEIVYHELASCNGSHEIACPPHWHELVEKRLAQAEGPKQEGEEGAAAEAQAGEEGEKEEREPRGSDSRNYQELIRLS